MGAMCVGSTQEYQVTNEIVVPFCLHYCRRCAPAGCVYKEMQACPTRTLTDRPQTACCVYDVKNHALRDQRAPRELSSRSWTQERAILDWTDPSAKIFSQRFDDATKPDGRRECRVLFVYRMNDTCKTRHDFFFSLGGLDRWIIWLSFISSNYADSSSLRFWLSRQRSVLLSALEWKEFTETLVIFACSSY